MIKLIHKSQFLKTKYMKKFFFLLFVILGNICSAQTIITCDKADRDTTEFKNLPWFGNNTYLEIFFRWDHISSYRKS